MSCPIRMIGETSGDAGAGVLETEIMIAFLLSGSRHRHTRAFAVDLHWKDLTSGMCSGGRPPVVSASRLPAGMLYFAAGAVVLVDLVSGLSVFVALASSSIRVSMDAMAGHET